MICRRLAPPAVGPRGSADHRCALPRPPRRPRCSPAETAAALGSGDRVRGHRPGSRPLAQGGRTRRCGPYPRQDGPCRRARHSHGLRQRRSGPGTGRDRRTLRRRRPALHPGASRGEQTVGPPSFASRPGQGSHMARPPDITPARPGPPLPRHASPPGPAGATTSAHPPDITPARPGPLLIPTHRALPSDQPGHPPRGHAGTSDPPSHRPHRGQALPPPSSHPAATALNHDVGDRRSTTALSPPPRTPTRLTSSARHHPPHKALTPLPRTPGSTRPPPLAQAPTPTAPPARPMSAATDQPAPDQDPRSETSAPAPAPTRASRTAQ